MSPATRTLILALVRQGKGMLSALEDWVKAQPD
jgi:hypothetical protein